VKRGLSSQTLGLSSGGEGLEQCGCCFFLRRSSGVHSAKDMSLAQEGWCLALIRFGI
jgi:hypothetical protein